VRWLGSYPFEVSHRRPHPLCSQCGSRPSNRAGIFFVRSSVVRMGSGEVERKALRPSRILCIRAVRTQPIAPDANPSMAISG
jgi:hypothetical protein